MSGFATERARSTRNRDLRALEDSFQTFNRVSKDLERAYARLESRAAIVEGRLLEANRKLMDKVTALGRETDELHGILDSIPCGVVVCDADGNVTMVNPAAERIMGRPARELMGRNARTLRGPGGQTMLLLGEPGAPSSQPVERAITNFAGSARFVCGSVATLPEGGQVEIFTDQTEVAHLRSQINRLDTLAALGEMAAAVAHEVRNPMNGVEGFAGLLEKALRSDGNAPTEVLLRYTDRIRKGVAEVNQIIGNLLLWARPERIHLEAVHLGDLAAEVREDVLAAMEEDEAAAIRLSLPGGPVTVKGDRLKLKLVVGNLVRNAVCAAGGGGRVEVTIDRVENRARIRVDDDGPGISPSVAGRLFQPFTTTKPTGTGLGLAIVKKLVDLHRGEVRVLGSSLGGARFVVEIPFAEGSRS